MFQVSNRDYIRIAALKFWKNDRQSKLEFSVLQKKSIDHNLKNEQDANPTRKPLGIKP